MASHTTTNNKISTLTQMFALINSVPDTTPSPPSPYEFEGSKDGSYELERVVANSSNNNQPTTYTRPSPTCQGSQRWECRTGLCERCRPRRPAEPVAESNWTIHENDFQQRIEESSEQMPAIPSPAVHRSSSRFTEELDSPDLEGGYSPHQPQPRGAAASRDSGFDNYLTRDFRDVALDNLDYDSAPRPPRRGLRYFCMGLLVLVVLVVVAIVAVELANGNGNGQNGGKESKGGEGQNRGQQTGAQPTKSAKWHYPYPTNL